MKFWRQMEATLDINKYFLEVQKCRNVVNFLSLSMKSRLKRLAHIMLMNFLHRCKLQWFFLKCYDSRYSEPLWKILSIRQFCTAVYVNLRNYFASQGTDNPSQFFLDPLSLVHTNTIEGNWSALKKTVPLRCRTRSLVSLYLVRFMITRESTEYLKTLINYLLHLSSVC